MLVIFLEEPPPILSGIATERGTTNRNVYLFIYFFLKIFQFYIWRTCQFPKITDENNKNLNYESMSPGLWEWTDKPHTEPGIART